MMKGFKRTSSVTTSTDESTGEVKWERPTPAEGWSIDRPNRTPIKVATDIRSMIASMNSEKED
jgi:hypothetical protein